MALFTFAIVPSFIFWTQIILSESKTLSKLALAPLESGFESINTANSVSSPFLFLAILFVLFDLELLLLFPATLSGFPTINIIFLWGVSISLMLITLAAEWAWCGLKWQF